VGLFFFSTFHINNDNSTILQANCVSHPDATHSNRHITQRREEQIKPKPKQGKPSIQKQIALSQIEFPQIVIKKESLE
jgi:hypothetical protein